MGHIYKYLGNKESARQLWENREALEKYIARLKEFWDDDKQEWLTSPLSNNTELQAKKLSNEQNTSRKV